MKTSVLIILTVTVLIVGALACHEQRLQERAARLYVWDAPDVCRIRASAGVLPPTGFSMFVGWGPMKQRKIAISLAVVAAIATPFASGTYEANPTSEGIVSAFE